jgi:hypothetical protein
MRSVGGGVGRAASSSFSPQAVGEDQAGSGSSSGSSSNNRRPGEPQVSYNIQESLEELGRLAETAGLKVICLSQIIRNMLSSTYIT